MGGGYWDVAPSCMGEPPKARKGRKTLNEECPLAVSIYRGIWFRQPGPPLADGKGPQTSQIDPDVERIES